jgi:sigma-B regulation protein RsbU (phosphoserine phosphatase)
MASGDVLLLFTDGVNEAMNSNHEQFGFDRAFQVVRDCHDEPAERIIAQLFERILQHMDNQPAMDDITAVVVKVC